MEVHQTVIEYFSPPPSAYLNAHRNHLVQVIITSSVSQTIHSTMRCQYQTVLNELLLAKAKTREQTIRDPHPRHKV